MGGGHMWTHLLLLLSPLPWQIRGNKVEHHHIGNILSPFSWKLVAVKSEVEQFSAMFFHEKGGAAAEAAAAAAACRVDYVTVHSSHPHGFHGNSLQ